MTIWTDLGLALEVAVVIVLAASWWATVSRPAPAAKGLFAPGVSVLKPLCGADPGLYAALRSFCLQDYPVFQLLFGLRDPADPAGAVVARLKAEFPQHDIGLIIEPRLIGMNYKVSNLAHLLPHARHAYLVLADADITVGRDYLQAVVAPLADPGVGIVTCLYKGRAGPGRAARVGALFINSWFVPSVLLARRLGSTAFAFGATIALRRDTLDAIGGFAPLASQLADDFVIGARTRALGRRTVLSTYLVETAVTEPGWATLLAHQLRWWRTIRVVNARGYAAAVLSLGLPVALVGAALAADGLGIGLVFLALVLRLVLHYAVSRRLRVPADWVLLPVADVLLFAVWIGGFLGRRVRWRDQRFAVRADGSIRVDRE
ncbi:MAG: bacteriohopanetetrol glucosamine biosynthesis glycosyltransferase HpnI [Acidiferrobacter sp.]